MIIDLTKPFVLEDTFECLERICDIFCNEDRGSISVNYTQKEPRFNIKGNYFPVGSTIQLLDNDVVSITAPNGTMTYIKKDPYAKKVKHGKKG